MTRARVDPDKRQRIAQACDTCKRRKQKCTGDKPCATCSKRNIECTFGSGPPEHDGEARKKRRRSTGDAGSIMMASGTESVAQVGQSQAGEGSIMSIDELEEDGHGSTPISSPHNASVLAKKKTNGDKDKSKSKGKERSHEPSRRAGAANDDDEDPTNGHRMAKLEIRSTRPATVTGSHGHHLESEPDGGPSHQTITSGPDEEAMLYPQPRMLQDSTGRLLYLGDSATLSYLQLIRMIVESVAGPSPFTLDPRRHRIMENTITLPPYIRPPHILPDRQCADILVESYFTNTNGFIEVVNRKSFIMAMDSCYSDPLTVDSPFLCILHLVFAIGLVLATPLPGTREDAVIRRLRDGQFDRAELFFRSAKCLGDPESGFEDADFWSVQALLLMSVYLLAVSKRNAAYAYYGMAVRSAFALGLHREEAMTIFKPEDIAVRKNLWRSLFVIDRFLAASLGRPAAISEEDCSGDVLFTPADGKRPTMSTAFNTRNTHAAGLDAAVRSSLVIGDVLKKVYSKRRVSTKVAQEIADRCKMWPPKLDPSLYWRQALMNPEIDAAQGIAILHVNLLYCHSVILLTRPFFLYLLSKVQQERTNTGGQSTPRFSPRMEKFSEACVQASCQSIILVQTAFEKNYLPQRNPFVLYFMFAASLIVLSNEFSSIYYNPSYEEYVQNAINIMAYCSGTDPQAERLLYILTTFRDVVANRDERLVGQPTRSLPSMAMLRGSNDPIANFFAPEQQQHVSGGQASGSAPQAPPPPGNVGGIPPALSRKNSLVSPAIPPNTVVPFMMHIHSQPHGHGVVPVAVNPVTGAPMTPLLNGVSPTLPAAAVAPGGSLHPSPTMAAAAAALRPGGGTGTGAPSSVDHDTGDSQGATDGEIDFDILWNNWPAHGSGAPGTAGSGAGGGGGVPGPSLDQPPTPSGTHMPGATPLPVTTMAGAFPVAASAGFASAAYHGYATGLATTIAPGPGGGLGLMNMNVPLFPTSDFG